jgi:hypothetical protein
MRTKVKTAEWDIMSNGKKRRWEKCRTPNKRRMGYYVEREKNVDWK